MAAISLSIDQTLLAADEALERRAAATWRPRAYLGASAMGHPCDRKLWLQFRWALEPELSAKSLKAIADGHASEAIMAERLRAVPGVTLYTEDENGLQFGFEDVDGHFRGNLDGVIEGIKQSKAVHVWEHKCVNQKKFDKLVSLVNADEANALENWDPIYYAQAQLYMHYFELNRHYLTCASPGTRDVCSVRTKIDKEVVAFLIERANAIVRADDPPLKLSESPDHPACRWCDYKDLCHGDRRVPKVSCRTCGHSTPAEAATWTCSLRNKRLDVDAQLASCRAHMYHPDLLAHLAKMMGYDSKLGCVRYETKDGKPFANGYRGDQTPTGVVLSVEIRAATEGCKHNGANLDWLGVIEQGPVDELRGRFGAEVRKVEATDATL